MEAKDKRGFVIGQGIRADGKQIPSLSHVALGPSEALTCYRILLYDTDCETVKPGFVLGISFRELLHMKYGDRKAQRLTFDPGFLGDSPQISAAVCAFKTVSDDFVFQRFLSDVATIEPRIKAILASETEQLRIVSR
jgi:hypothetical protein